MDGQQIRCKACGAPLGPGTAFCHNCGMQQASGTPLPGEPGAAAGTAWPRPPDPGMVAPEHKAPPPLWGGQDAAGAVHQAGSAQAQRNNTRLLAVLIGVLVGLPLLLAILGIAASLAIPALLTARQGGAKEQARQVLLNVATAQYAYYANNGCYASTLPELDAFTRQTNRGRPLWNVPVKMTLVMTGDGEVFTATITCNSPPLKLTLDDSGQIE